MSVRVGNAEPPPARLITSYYFGLRPLASAKAITGTHFAPSRMEAGAKVVFAPLGMKQDYADYWIAEPHSGILARVSCSSGSNKDEGTRSREVELVRGGWSQGRALKRALALTEVTWTIGPANKPAVSTDEQAEGDACGSTKHSR